MSKRLILILLMVVALLAACGPSAAEMEQTGDGAEAPAPATRNNEDPFNAITEETGALEEDVSAPADNEPVGDRSLSITVAEGTQTVDARGIPVGFTEQGYAFRGDPAAPVVMEEFSDFQCPYCGRFYEQTLPSLEENQIKNGDMVLVFYDYPLPSHLQAPAAAEAAHCAGEEGAVSYWEMHDMLFDNLDQWSGRGNAADLFAEFAEEMGLNGADFTSCMESGRYRERVQTAMDAGTARGVNSTPTFFINDQLLLGAQPLSVFNQAIAQVKEGQPLAAEEPEGAPSPPPVPTPAVFNSDDIASALGAPDAPVTIVEFTDYQCPFCAQYVAESLPLILEQYVETGRARYIQKDFPLTDIHPVAPLAASVARCAGEQDAYWEMHDALFAEQSAWSNASESNLEPFLSLAGGLGLDTDELANCIESGRFEQAVQANLQEGTALGISGTPFFFINGYPISGAQPFGLLGHVIERAEDNTLAELYSQPVAPQAGDPDSVPIGDAPFIGNPDAPVTIIEYTDFQCPFCERHYRETYPQIVKNYVDTGLVRYVFMDFPLLSIHAQALEAAEAARCAGEQDAYAEMHDQIFASQSQWGDNSSATEIFVDLARELDLDTDQFVSCLESSRHQPAIFGDLLAGSRLGVQGTPAFFINGQFVNGAQPYSAFEQTVDQFLP